MMLPTIVRRGARGFLLPFALLAICLALPSALQAATISVTTTADDTSTNGNCSLREAILAANGDTAVDVCASGSGPDVIMIPAGTYTLAIPGQDEDAAATGDLDLIGDVQIFGAGSAATVVDAGGFDRVFHVVTAGIDVSIEDSTVTGGNVDASGPDYYGGGILNEGGFLTVARTVVDGNASQYAGGGIYSADGALTVVDSTLTDNHCNFGTGDTGCAIRADSFGATAMEFELSGSTVAYNVNEFGFGVAVMMVCSGVGDALANIHNSTISQNLGGTFPSSTSGGMYIEDDPIGLPGDALALLNNVTITENTNIGAFASANPTDEASIAISNSILADNAEYDCEGYVTSAGYNLVGDAEPPFPSEQRDCVFDQPGDETVADPLLGPLQSNGGPTATHALDAASPARNSANPQTPGSGGFACESTDQRGVVRIDCDKGAFEEQSLVTCPLAPRNDCLVATRATFQLRDKDSDGAGPGDKIGWKWREQPATTLADLGNPTATSDYALCVYAGATPALVAGAEVPGGVTCGSDGCWKATGTKGFKFRDATTSYDGIKSIKLKALASPGDARMSLVGKGSGLKFAGLPLVPPVVVQMNRTGATCWETTHTLSLIQTNTIKGFRSTIP